MAPATPDQPPAAETWQHLEQAAARIRVAIADSVVVENRLPVPVQQNIALPLRLAAGSAVIDREPPAGQDEVAVNWAIISSNSDTLSRLQRILSG